MKVFTIYSDNHSIELYNSFFGREKIKVNGKKVSSKYSLTGSVHAFSLPNNGQETKYKVRFRTGLPASCDVYKDGEPVIESPRYGFWRGFFYGLVFVLIYRLLEGDLIF